MHRLRGRKPVPGPGRSHGGHRGRRRPRARDQCRLDPREDGAGCRDDRAGRGFSGLRVSNVTRAIRPGSTWTRWRGSGPASPTGPASRRFGVHRKERRGERRRFRPSARAQRIFHRRRPGAPPGSRPSRARAVDAGGGPDRPRQPVRAHEVSPGLHGSWRQTHSRGRSPLLRKRCGAGCKLPRLRGSHGKQGAVPDAARVQRCRLRQPAGPGVAGARGPSPVGRGQPRATRTQRRWTDRAVRRPERGSRPRPVARRCHRGAPLGRVVGQPLPGPVLYRTAAHRPGRRGAVPAGCVATRGGVRPAGRRHQRGVLFERGRLRGARNPGLHPPGQDPRRSAPGAPLQRRPVFQIRRGDGGAVRGASGSPGELRGNRPPLLGLAGHRRDLPALLPGTRGR